jgi:SPP1 gp7 family putative phage head morphogenesis protein
MDWDVSPDPLDFEEALAWFLGRVPMTRSAFEALEAEAKRRAFFVSNVAQVDVVEQVMTSLDKSLAEGSTLAEWKADIGDKLEAAWGDDVANPAHRMETIYRTNVQGAYGHGRYEQQTDPAVLKRRPYWRLDVLVDNRTSDVCRPLAGVVKAADDKFWDDHTPPLHFNCRSTTVALTNAEAEAEGITETPPKVDAGEGFGRRPVRANEWTPDAAVYSPEVKDELEAKLTEAPPPPKPVSARPAVPQAGRALSAEDYITESGAQWDRIWDDVTPKQREVLRDYTGRGFIDVNKALRAPEALPKKARAVAEEKVLQLDALLDKAGPMKESVTVHRAFMLGPVDDVQALVGDSFTDRGFMSSSALPNVVDRFAKDDGSAIAEIIVPRGARAMYVGSVGKHANEAEVLLGRGSKFKIIGAARDDAGLLRLQLEML